MFVKTKLRNALQAVDDARTAMRRARNNNADQDTDQQIRRAMRELDEAEQLIKRAISDLPEE